MHKDKAHVQDILDSMRLIITYVKGLSCPQFLGQQATIDAVNRRLEIIGEAVKRLSAPLRDQHPEIPWQKMAGMRDRLIHGYDKIELDVVFLACSQVIPSLIPTIESILNSLPDPE